MDNYEKNFGMTYEEAIKVILDIPIYGNDYSYDISKYQTAKALAIHALEEQKKIEKIIDELNSLGN